MDCSLARPDASVSTEWQGLARRALVPWGHNSPEVLLPVLRAEKKAILALVRDSEGLQLALPLMPPRFSFLAHSNLSTPVSYFGLPHLDRQKAGAALEAMLRKLGGPLLLHSVPLQGPLWESIEEASGYRAVIRSWERSVLRPCGTYENWFEQSFERKRRKEYRRLQTRLSEQGRLEALSFAAGDNAARWVDEFLELEAAGWKGKRGSALQGDAAVAAILREACEGLAEARKLRFWKLALDGKPVAMLFAVVESNEAWLGKIAFAESFSKYSPGVLLILHATEQIFAEGLAQADSCAIPDHPMINHLWRDRLRVADVMIAGKTIASTRCDLAVTLERLRHGLRGHARTVFYKLTGRHRS